MLHKNGRSVQGSKSGRYSYIITWLSKNVSIADVLYSAPTKKTWGKTIVIILVTTTT